ncbi:unnamed protein product, partial [Ectocarpus sp. 8 AP-2014]
VSNHKASPSTQHSRSRRHKYRRQGRDQAGPPSRAADIKINNSSSVTICIQQQNTQQDGSFGPLARSSSNIAAEQAAAINRTRKNNQNSTAVRYPPRARPPIHSRC